MNRPEESKSKKLPLPLLGLGIYFKKENTPFLSTELF